MPSLVSVVRYLFADSRISSDPFCPASCRRFCGMMPEVSRSLRNMTILMSSLLFSGENVGMCATISFHVKVGPSFSAG